MSTHTFLILLGLYVVVATAAGSPLESNSTRRANVKCGQIDRVQHASYLSQTTAHGTPQASDRLMKELTDVYKSVSYKKGLLKVRLVDDNLYEWEVLLSIADPECKLRKDLMRLWKGQGDHIVLRVTFNDNYPSEPPFVRVAYPVLYGGHVMPSGALCMQLLTQQDWIPDCTPESLFLSIAALLMDGKTRLDGIKSSGKIEEHYNPELAKKHFDHVSDYHKNNGW